ncbi:Coiled-coil domain-containing 25 isoform A [Chlorella sorokiniana]|uniref:Coiled-coil domain-containing 25 isoform A n=1 Tax=Chlorella sorokiniana TaxID=3076 RepID=A0A2P6TXY9_CHLSO|nr:Coiled-coil domain-containing 25 isoform A [Chlorella sorokiniana]|eukprot:PRW58921.1 Coiled-coil domain-containing 25 isoform A [Chlorella sorokiniana]
MVFYFTPRGCTPGKDDWLLYMGLDKYENEDLIKYSLPQDVWFHVDSLSSAHVYLRLPEGKSMHDIPKETLEDACQLVKANSIQVGARMAFMYACASDGGWLHCQLVKANSIQGNKMSNIPIVYTPASNLRKSADMAVGQVGFHDDKLVKRTQVQRRLNEIVNRLNKTQKERFPDLAAEKAAWEKEQAGKAKAAAAVQRKSEKEEKEEQKRQQDMLDYKHIMRDEAMVTAGELGQKYESAEAYEDDFM